MPLLYKRLRHHNGWVYKCTVLFVNLGLEQQRRYCIIFIRKKKRFGSDGVEHFSERKKKKGVRKSIRREEEHIRKTEYHKTDRSHS